jgi:hypothetical protein
VLFIQDTTNAGSDHQPDNNSTRQTFLHKERNTRCYHFISATPAYRAHAVATLNLVQYRHVIVTRDGVWFGHLIH